jgi:hypothetical protein
MTSPPSRIGEQLWHLLPGLYRVRDREQLDQPGDLRVLLDSVGELLDLVRGTLDQRLADAFVDPPDDPAERTIQPWLLPYAAALLDARLTSPHTAGRRRELAVAIAARQRRGTSAGLRLVTDAVRRRDTPPRSDRARVEVVEGWTRVAVTPRVAHPMLPASAFGVPQDPAAADSPVVAALSPGLPGGTVDLRERSRAITAPRSHPAARTVDPDGVTWRQHAPRGAPCFPDSYEDASLRTVDVRDPDWRQGHAHPRRVVLFAAPPVGAFPARREAVSDPPPDLTVPADVPASRPAPGGTGPDDHAPGGASEGSLTAVTLVDRVLGEVVITEGAVHLVRCAVRRLVIDPTVVPGSVTIRAWDSLFGSIDTSGQLRLEHCTVLGTTRGGPLLVSDSILAGPVDDLDAEGCVRYSRVPVLPPSGGTTAHGCTTDDPVFHAMPSCVGGEHVPGTAAFGEPGCGVLHPAAPASIREGAEDGGEMGVWHHRAHALESAAVMEKTEHGLPVGLRAVLVPDPRLHHPPPTLHPLDDVDGEDTG